MPENGAAIIFLTPRQLAALADLPRELVDIMLTGNLVDDPTLPREVHRDDQGEFSTPGKRPETWRERAQRLEEEVRRLRPLAGLLGDLDRCEHGRHEGDQCSGAHPGGCDGPSRGNPVMVDDPATSTRVEWWADRNNHGVIPPRLIGFTVHARAVCVPDRANMHDPNTWTPPLDADTTTIITRTGAPHG